MVEVLGYYKKERKSFWSAFIGNVLGLLGLGDRRFVGFGLDFFSFTSWMRGDSELVFAGVAMRSFLLGVIRCSDLRSCSLFFLGNL